jgi:hypothetical protein
MQLAPVRNRWFRWATHVVGSAAVTALITLLTLLPFFPGRYDRLSVPLSTMSQVFGIVGCILAPIGALWLASGFGGRLARMQRPAAITALVASSIVGILLSVIAWIESGLCLGLGVLVLLAYVVIRAARRLRTLASTTQRAVPPAALHLLLVPPSVLFLQLLLVGPAIESGTARAIQNSSALIDDIEKYRAAHGQYPVSLHSVWEDYSPSVLGIDRYHYEPSGEAYNLFFEQHTCVFGTRAFVMYNPLDQQVMTSHNMDLLRRTTEQLALRRGYYSVRDTPHAHWKVFSFD